MEKMYRWRFQEGLLKYPTIKLKILADFAEHVSDLSDDTVAKARARAEELKHMKDDASVVDFEHYEAELERSLTRVKIADKWKNRKYRM
jgi:F0F1-type ATP synthase epsilon subunit